MSKGANPPFQCGTTVAVSATASATNTALPGTGETALITNNGTASLYVAFSTDPAATVTVPVAGTTQSGTYVVLAGGQRAAYCGRQASQVAMILASGSGTVVIERGDGAAR